LSTNKHKNQILNDESLESNNSNTNSNLPKKSLNILNWFEESSSPIFLFFIFLIVISLFSLIILGVTGFRAILGFFIFIIIPTYLILYSLKLDNSEKFILSLFLGTALIPALLWYVNRIIPSLKVSLIVTFILFIIAGYILSKKVNGKG